MFALNIGFMVLTSIFATSATRRIAPLFNSTAPIVNLGYASYQGYHDSAFRLNVFKRCAATANDLAYQTPRKPLDTELAAFDTPLLQLASYVGKRLRPQQITTPSFKPCLNHRSVHNPAPRKPLQYMASTLDQVMKTACSLMFTHPQMPGGCQSWYGFVC